MQHVASAQVIFEIIYFCWKLYWCTHLLSRLTWCTRRFNCSSAHRLLRGGIWVFHRNISISTGREEVVLGYYQSYSVCAVTFSNKCLNHAECILNENMWAQYYSSRTLVRKKCVNRKVVHGNKVRSVTLHFYKSNRCKIFSMADNISDSMSSKLSNWRYQLLLHRFLL